MKLTHLYLEQFRNYESLDLDFTASNVMALVGQNAQGKTNVLEAIAFLALGKSFRTHRPLETLRWEAPHGRVRGELAEAKAETLEVFMQRKPEQKKMKLNGELAAPKDFLGNLRVVLFTPEHLLLITGSPKLRRQYLDRTLIQLDRDYVEQMSQLQKILRQRNALLKNLQRRSNASSTDSGNSLDAWDLQLVDVSEKIWARRQAFVDYLKWYIPDLYKQIAGTKDELSLSYEPNVDRFEEKLVAQREADLRMGSTGIGPHRDDFRLTLNGHPMEESASRGECRSAVLALKMAEMRYIEKETGQKPLLLLDDVFSELDEFRQTQLGELLKDYQTVITTTALEHLSGLEGAQVYEVSSAELKAC